VNHKLAQTNSVSMFQTSHFKTSHKKTISRKSQHSSRPKPRPRPKPFLSKAKATTFLSSSCPQGRGQSPRTPSLASACSWCLICTHGFSWPGQIKRQRSSGVLQQHGAISALDILEHHTHVLLQR